MKHYLIILLSGLTPLLQSCLSNNTPTTFRVGVRALPEQINPRENEVNIYHYMNLHLYYPLFEVTRSGGLDSHFLDIPRTISTSKMFTDFRFCLKASVRFSDGSPILAQHLEYAIKHIHQTSLEVKKLSRVTPISSDCIEVTLEKPDLKYFYKMTAVQSTLLKAEPSKSNLIPTGLGPYIVQEIAKDRLSLKLTPDQESAHFTKVDFVKIEDPDDGIKRELHDWNHIWQHQGGNTPIPDSVRSHSRKFQQNLLRSLIILANVADPALRRKINFCFNRSKYKNMLGLELQDIPGYLPNGLAGQSVTFEQIKDTWEVNSKACQPKSLEKEIPFFFFYPQLEVPIRAFFESEKARLPIRVKPILISLNEAIKILFSKSEFLMPTMIDTMRANPTGFFSTMVGPDRVLIENMPGLDALVRDAAAADNEEQAESQFTRAHQILLSSGYIIPLGQIKATYYYPDFIKAIPVVDPANGFPMIHKIEVR